MDQCSAMRSPLSYLPRAARLLCALLFAAGLVAQGAADAAAQTPPSARAPVVRDGTLTQLSGSSGCVVGQSATSRAGCTVVRALNGPGPFLGSRAVAVSPDGRNVYVAASDAKAIAVFARDARTGALRQRSGTAGCIAVGGSGGCARGRSLTGPNSVAVSGDGKTVYATSFESDAVAVLRRNRKTGALTQTKNATGCLTGRAGTTGCTVVRGIDGPDVVVVSPDGGNVYVGSFVGNAIAVFDRDASSGALSQPTDSSGCIAATATQGCATGIALNAPEGMAISGDGATVYVASALSNAVVVLSRNASTGALTQATDGSGCIVAAALAGCTTGTQLVGANAVAVSPAGDTVYVTSLTSNSVTTFTRTPSTGALAQPSGTSGCVIFLLAVGCSLGRNLDAPEGLVVSSDGGSVYATAFGSGAIVVLDRDSGSGALKQKPRRPGCLVKAGRQQCLRGRALLGASSIAVSPDGRHVYATAFASDAVAVFKRAAR
jgi:DNA-binding beta-propeller fold protein YncE